MGPASAAFGFGPGGADGSEAAPARAAAPSRDGDQGSTIKDATGHLIHAHGPTLDRRSSVDDTTRARTVSEPWRTARDDSTMARRRAHGLRGDGASGNDSNATPPVSSAVADAENMEALRARLQRTAVTEAQQLLRRQELGRLGGRLAGNVGENRFRVGRAPDNRSVCQLRTCKQPILKGELRLGKQPPSLRHGHNPKVTWYHPRCAMKSFASCTKNSRVIKKVEDIDEGFSELDNEEQALIRRVVDGVPATRPAPVAEGSNNTLEPTTLFSL